MRVVVDTSVIIHWLRTGEKLLGDDVEVVISIVTIGELFSGKSAQMEGRQRKILMDVLDGWEVDGADEKGAILAGELRYKHKLSLGDAFVAALALEEKLPLATLDKKAFANIPHIKFFSVETKHKTN